MKITSLLTCSAIASAVSLIATSLGGLDLPTSCTIFTASLLTLTAMTDYAPKRRFALAKPTRLHHAKPVLLTSLVPAVRSASLAAG